MPLSEIDAICRACGNQFRGLPTRTFLGFLSLTCPNCKKPVPYPLTSPYRVGYWVLFPLFAFAFGYSLSQGEVQLSGVAAVAILVALVRDWQLRRQNRSAVARGVARLLVVLAVLAGLVTLGRSVELWSATVAAILLALGCAQLSVLLFVRSDISAPFTRPAGQMVIATGVTIIVHAIPIALLRYVSHSGFESAANAARLSIVDTDAERWATISGVAALLITLWALALPVFAWWKWFGQRDTSGRLTRA